MKSSSSRKMGDLINTAEERSFAAGYKTSAEGLKAVFVDPPVDPNTLSGHSPRSTLYSNVKQ